LGVPEKAKINGFSQVQFCGLRLQNSRDFFQIHPNTLIIPQDKGDKSDFDGHERKNIGQYRIILSADTASEVRQMPSQKRR